MSSHTGLAFASDAECISQEPADVRNSGSILIFELVNICHLPTLKTKGLIERYIAHTRTRQTITVIKEEDSFSGNEQTSSVMAIIEQLQTAHGDMTIQADISVSKSHADQAFSYSQVSSKIVASGAAAYTRKVIENVNVALGGEGFSVKISKVLHMKKPWYAPSGIFRKEVYKGLSKDLVLITDRHLIILEERS